ncbi:tRNA (adenosine(37)-N6)-threonylcarbamoyltransferase complex ATPase subunit type 1 TsaE [Maricaulaceae bacterium MS644]
MGRLALTLPGTAAAARFGARLAAALKVGDAVLLFGELGAGKTTLARAVIEALTGETDAPSPTFTLVQSYETGAGFLLLHADLYRLTDEGELDELGLDEALDHGAALIEWPDRAPGWRPPDRLEIQLDETEDGGRRARLTAFGAWEDRLGQLAD